MTNSQPRTANGRFARIINPKKIIKATFYPLAAVTLIAGITYSATWWANAVESTATVYTIRNAATPLEAVKAMEADDESKVKAKIQEKKQEVINAIAKCETGSLTEPDGAIIFDSNRLASVGKLQFQVDTVKRYVKLFEERDITNAEAISIAIDGKKAEALAMRIVFEDEGKAENNWFNCNKKLGISAQVELIKSIESTLDL